MESQSNPLLYPVILETMFENLTWEELCIARQVSHTWLKTSKKEWLLKGPVKCLDHSTSGNSINVFSGRSSTIVATYWDGATQYKKFKLSQFCFSSSWLTDSAFWKSNGPNLTYLELEGCTILCDDACRQLLYSNNTPSLCTLKLVKVKYTYRCGSTKCIPDIPMDSTVDSMKTILIEYSSPVYNNLPLTWKSILKRYPYLEVLELRNYNVRDGESELERVMEGIRTFASISARGRHPLKSLYIDTEESSRIMPFPTALLQHFRTEFRQKVESPALELKKLAFGYSYEDYLTVTLAECQEIIDNQKNSLQELTFRGYVNGWGDIRRLQNIFKLFNLPQLLLLTRLDIWDCRMRSLRFLFQCPNLKYLNLVFHTTLRAAHPAWNIVRDNKIDWGEAEKARYQCPSLVSFCHNLFVDWSADDMTRLSTFFPNLTSLLIHANNASFSEMCRVFPNLCRLFVFHSQVSNTVFTGIQDDGDPTADGDIVENRESLPNITYLQDLEFIAIHCFGLRRIKDDNEWPLGKLDAFAAREGLLKLPNLKEIQLSPMGISQDGLDALKNEFKGKIFNSNDQLPSVLEFVF